MPIRLIERFRKHPEVCFLAFDLSPATLQTCEEDDVQAMVELFQDLIPLDQNEIALLDDVATTGDRELLKAWALCCVERRGGYTPFGILGIEVVPGGQLIDFVSSQRWVQGLKVTRGELTQAYAYLLNSLRQMVMLPVWVPETKDAWNMTTITLGPVPPYDYDPNEPMNIAAKQAARAGVTVVVAAGNEGHLLPGNSLNPWSVAPWVIGVGATDKEGTRLLEISSCGVSGQPYEAPTVVAPGETTSPFGGFNHGFKVALEQISNASPGTVTTAVVGAEVYNFIMDRSGRIGVSQIKEGRSSPVAPLEDVLKFLEETDGLYLQKLRGTSFAAEYFGAIIHKIVQRLKPLLPDLHASQRPKLIKTIVEDMARPFADKPPWAVGKGFVDAKIAEDYLNSLDSDQLATLRARAEDRVIDPVRRANIANDDGPE